MKIENYYETDVKIVKRVTLEPHDSINKHKAPTKEMSIEVLDGIINFEVHEEQSLKHLPLSKGDKYSLKNNEEHAVHNPNWLPATFLLYLYK